jgi:hypothetical protein
MRVLLRLPGFVAFAAVLVSSFYLLALPNSRAHATWKPEYATASAPALTNIRPGTPQRCAALADLPRLAPKKSQAPSGVRRSMSCDDSDAQYLILIALMTVPSAGFVVNEVGFALPTASPVNEKL